MQLSQNKKPPWRDVQGGKQLKDYEKNTILLFL